MKCTSFQFLKELLQWSSSWKFSLGDSRIAMNWGKLKSGVGQVRHPQIASTSSSEQMARRTALGEEITDFPPHTHEASHSWALLWSTPISCSRSSRKRSTTTDFSFRRPRKCQTIHVRGFCPSSAQRHRPVVCSVVHPVLSFQFAVQHDAGLRQCLQEQQTKAKKLSELTNQRIMYISVQCGTRAHVRCTVRVAYTLPRKERPCASENQDS